MRPPALPRVPLPTGLDQLTPVQMVIAVVLLALVLVVAYKIGKVILRVVAGLLFLGLMGSGIWYLLNR